jgi:2'-5' RNA ligase
MKQVGIPLILTFTLDTESKARLDAWRKEYFPKERNHLSAHLTIYHQLPGQNFDPICVALEDFANAQKPIPIYFESLKTRQGFVGVHIESKALVEARSQLSLHLGEQLRAQDKQPYRPHVTVTNLGSPKDALSCFQALETKFEPWEGLATGFDLYHYRGGPWEFARQFPFAT